MNKSEMESRLHERHVKHFDTTLEAMYFSPGRVNLIGEHTDYSGGHVFPMTIDLGIFATVSQRRDTAIRIVSADYPALGVMVLEQAKGYDASRGFMNYAEGIVHGLKNAGYHVTCGLDISLLSTLPKSAGLSSSAALDVLLLRVFSEQFGWGLTPLEIVKFAQAVENTYIGVSSGVMDPFVIAHGEDGLALWLDTETLQYEKVPFDFSEAAIVLMNTNKPRDLVDSAYNERFETIREASRHFEGPLGKVSFETFAAKADAFEPQMRRRVRHVVTENARTREAKKALENRDYVTFGALMNASHDSLRDDFDVSCAELDFLVENNRALGALGARMSGAGFGGTMLAMYKREATPAFEGLIDAYQERFGLALDVHDARGARGTHRIRRDS